MTHDDATPAPVTEELFPELPPRAVPRVLWRTGRHVGRHIYLQAGPEPSDSDVPIGTLDTPELAAEACEARNARAAAAELPADGSVRAAESLAAVGAGDGVPVPQNASQGRPARVEVKGFRDLGVVLVSESTLAGEPMLRAESANGAVAEFPASSLHFITWLPEGAQERPAISSGDPWGHGDDDEAYSSDDDRGPF